MATNKWTAKTLTLFFLTNIIVGCGGNGDSNSDDDILDGNSDTIIGISRPVSYGSGSATILEGTWVADCVTIRIGTTITGYAKSVAVYTGNGISSKGNTYSDSDCVTLTSSVTSKSDILIRNQTTSDSGLVAYPIDITTVQSTVTLPNGNIIDGVPGITSYAIIRVDVDKLYGAKIPDPMLLDLSLPIPGSTPSNRITVLNFDYFSSRL